MGQVDSGGARHITGTWPDLVTRGPQQVLALSFSSSGTPGKSLHLSTWAYFITCKMRSLFCRGIDVETADLEAMGILESKCTCEGLFLFF